jgi:hypothetical protein
MNRHKTTEGAAMSTQGSDMQWDNPGFADFWSNFRLSPWKWVDEIAKRSRYLVTSVLVVYAVYAFMTFFTGRGDHRILLLKDYPSIHVILFGFILVIWLVIRWRHQIPSIFQWLWESKRLAARAGDLKYEFEQYLQDYQKALLSRIRPLSISICLLALFIIIGLWAGIPRFLAAFFSPMSVIVLYLTLFIGFFWIFMIGQLSWILYVTGRHIRALTQKFMITIQPGHSDRCGGLKPLGDFCFDAAVPLIGGGIILSTIPILNWDIDQVLSVMASAAIFVVIAPLTIMTVFIPLWNIHIEMTGQKRRYGDSFAIQAMTLEQIILLHTSEKGNIKKAEIAKDKLEILQTVNPGKISFPVWPFKFTGTVLTLFSPQIIQLIVEAVTKIYATFFK